VVTIEIEWSRNLHLESTQNTTLTMSGKNVVQKGAKSATVKKYVPPFLKTYIKSGEAVAAPPLGPALGAVSQSLLH